MKLTVIIVSTFRRQFVSQALDSVVRSARALNSNTEILVIKNYVDDDLDSGLRSRGSFVIQARRLGLGAKIIEAAERAAGDVLVLLEDDDLFTPEKLPVVFQAFVDHPDLTFYHNSMREVRTDLTPTKHYGQRHGRSRVLRAPFERAEMDRILREGGMNLVSSMAARRDLILDYKGMISAILKGGVDHALFLSAIDAGGCIIFDSRPLTLYRIGDQNMSLPNPFASDYVSRKASYVLGSLSEIESVRRFLTTQFAKEVANDFVLEHRIHAASIDLKAASEIEIDTILSGLSLSFRWRSGPFAVLVALAALSRYSGSSGMGLYRAAAKVLR